MSQPSSVQSSLVGALETLWASGSPVAGSTVQQRERVASCALRRMKSFGRRGVAEGDRRSQVVDLAKGLAAHLERKSELVGALLKDYEHLAEGLLTAAAHDAGDRKA